MQIWQGVECISGPEDRPWIQMNMCVLRSRREPQGRTLQARPSCTWQAGAEPSAITTLLSKASYAGSLFFPLAQRPRGCTKHEALILSPFPLCFGLTEA